MFRGIGAFVSLMIHGAVVAGLFLILACPEQGKTDVPVMILLDNRGAPSEQPHHSLKPAPRERNIPPAEKPLAAPQPAMVAVADASALAVPAETVSPATPEPVSKPSIGKEQEIGQRVDTGADNVQKMARGYLDGHFSYLRELIIKRLKYPPDAKRKGWMGRVTASFVILESGAITELKVLSSSGYRTLDENVLETISSLGTLPKPPVKVEIVMPISYSLE